MKSETELHLNEIEPMVAIWVGLKESTVDLSERPDREEPRLRSRSLRVALTFQNSPLFGM